MFKSRLIGQICPKRAVRTCPWNADLWFTHLCIHSTNMHSVLGTVLSFGIMVMNKIRSPSLLREKNPPRMYVETIKLMYSKSLVQCLIYNTNSVSVIFCLSFLKHFITQCVVHGPEFLVPPYRLRICIVTRSPGYL